MSKTGKPGPAMTAAAAYVAAHPGCTKKDAAEACGPHGSLRYGYQAVDRAIAAGLITARLRGFRYALYPA